MTPVDQPISTEALFQAYTFTEYQRTVFKCFAFKQTGTILEEKELYSHVEKIADQGCQHLVENILTDLVFVDENGVVSLKPGQELEMQKKLSTFVSNQLINVPF